MKLTKWFEFLKIIMTKISEFIDCTFYFALIFTLFYILMYQSVAELEQKWQSEVDDAMQGKLENNMPFFYDYHFNEVSEYMLGA